MRGGRRCGIFVFLIQAQFVIGSRFLLPVVDRLDIYVARGWIDVSSCTPQVGHTVSSIVSPRLTTSALGRPACANSCSTTSSRGR